MIHQSLELQRTRDAKAEVKYQVQLDHYEKEQKRDSYSMRWFRSREWERYASAREPINGNR